VTELVFDDDASRRLEGIYRSRDAIRRRQIVRDALRASPGERILDAGCGPGFYCAELAEEVGPSGSVVGVDGSGSMLTLAARRCEQLPNVEFREGDAASLPVEDESFDAALSVQVMEYVADATQGLRELHRALRPGGRVVVWDVDWATVSLHSGDDARTARVLTAWDEHLAHPWLPRTLASRLRAAGFTGVRMEAHPFVSTELDPETYGAALIPFIAGFVAGRGGISDADADAWLAEQRELGERDEFYFAVTQCCFTATKAPS
jgi:ubiquinone/menaquinone biosynthesis C-methylase UbiE